MFKLFLLLWHSYQLRSNTVSTDASAGVASSFTSIDLTTVDSMIDDLDWDDGTEDPTTHVSKNTTQRDNAINIY